MQQSSGALAVPQIDPLLAGKGEMGRLLRETDWSRTPLGPIHRWPQSLRAVTLLTLESAFPMIVGWGPDFLFLYNDRFLPIVGNKHPRSFGQPARVIFSEVWELVQPLFLRTQQGEAVAIDDLLAPLNRNGYLENCYFTFSYSPLRGDDGVISGMLVVVSETTRRVESERRSATLRELALRAPNARSPEDACLQALDAFQGNQADVPFAATYLLSADGASVQLVQSIGLDRNHPVAPPALQLSDPRASEGGLYEFIKAPISEPTRPFVVENAAARFGQLPAGPYPENTHTLIAFPLRPAGTTRPAGVLVVGVSPRRKRDAAYQDFFQKAADQLTIAIASAYALDDQRRRVAEELERAEMYIKLAQLRKDASIVIERDRMRLYEVLMSAPAIVAVLSGPEHIFELANPAYLKLVGRSDPSLLIGRSVGDALPEVAEQGYIEILDRVYATGEPFAGTEMKVELDRGSGGTREETYLNFCYQPIRDQAGKIDGILVHAVEVTDQVHARRRAEALALKIGEERRLYLTMLSHTPDFVYVFDRQHRFIYANESLLKMWGRAIEDAIGKTCWELGYEPWHAAMHDREIEQVIATRAPIRGEVPFNGTQGRRIYDYIFVPVLGLNNEVEAIAGSTRDVTEMVKARETVAERRQELEQMVSERTAKLKEAVEQMEEFSYSVSHDLRSPIRAMRGYAEAMLEDYGDHLDPQGREMMQRIQRSGARMDRLIQDLLTYSRLTRRDMKVEPVPLARLIKEVIQQYPEMEPTRARIVLSDSLPTVLGHEPSLTQVFSNLLSNAVKFVRAGQTPEVEVDYEVVGDHARIWIRDHGIGIDPRYRRRLFGLFERVHPEGNYEGTGIGLAIVRKAIERMNGKVGVESDGRNGSAFWLELPLAAES